MTLKEQMAECGMSVAELAEKTGLSERSIYRLMNGSIPHPTTAMKLNMVFNSAKNSSEVMRLRSEKGWSLRELAERAGVTTKTIQRIEQGQPIREAMKVAIYRALRDEPAPVVEEPKVKRENSQQQPRTRNNPNSDRRMKMNLTQAELAKLAGVSIMSVKRYESGMSMNKNTVELIENALK